MNVGIDWVAVAILATAYVFAQLRFVPVRLRFGVFSAACAAVAIFKLRGGAASSNLIFAIIAGGLAVWYAIKALRGREL
jgi:hypothetical protein